MKISSFLKKELKFGDIPEVFWTDSEVVRGYVSTIQDDSTPLLQIEFSPFVSTLNQINGEEWTQRKTLQMRLLEA